MKSEEYFDLYQKLKPYFKRDIPFDAFVFFTQIIESVKTETDAIKLVEFVKFGKVSE